MFPVSPLTPGKLGATLSLNSEESFDSTDGEDTVQQGQFRILEELKKVNHSLINHRLDVVEGQVTARRHRRDSNRDNKLNWPHEYIWGGSNKQCISYDQLNLSVFVHGFVKRVLDEDILKYKEKMLSCLCDLMKDSNDFTWINAKASHAVLLCEMEQGGITWSSASCIDHIRRSHVLRHTAPARSNWVKGHEQVRKP